MAGPGKARVTVNSPFQDAVQKRTFCFLGPWLSVRNSILAFKIKTRLPKCKFNLMAIFLMTVYAHSRENKRKKRKKRGVIYLKNNGLFLGRGAMEN